MICQKCKNKIPDHSIAVLFRGIALCIACLDEELRSQLVTSPVDSILIVEFASNGKPHIDEGGK